MITKICTNKDCGKELPATLEFFHKQNGGKFGLAPQCKECRSRIQKEYRKQNAEKEKLRHKKWYLKNKKVIFEKTKEYRKKYYQENKDIILKKVKIYRQENKEKLSIKNKEYKEQNKQYFVDYWTNNKEKLLKKHIEYNNKKYKEDLDFRIKSNLRSRLYQSLKGNIKSKNTLDLLGCSVEFLKEHLQSQFTKDMTWDNHSLHGWHIDHIYPCSSFNLEDPKEQEICFHWSNLQPLWAEDNLKKSYKIK